MQQNAQLQNAKCYKTPNGTKGPQSKKNAQIQKNCKILKSRILKKLKFCELKGGVLFQG